MTEAKKAQDPEVASDEAVFKEKFGSVEPEKKAESKPQMVEAKKAPVPVESYDSIKAKIEAQI